IAAIGFSRRRFETDAEARMSSSPSLAMSLSFALNSWLCVSSDDTWSRYSDTIPSSLARSASLRGTDPAAWVVSTGATGCGASRASELGVAAGEAGVSPASSGDGGDTSRGCSVTESLPCYVRRAGSFVLCLPNRNTPPAAQQASHRRQFLRIRLCLGEQVADLRQAGRQRPDGPTGRSELRVVQLVPGDRRADRGARRRSDRVRRDERLDRRGVGVVEPSPSLARLRRPLPRDEIRNGRADRPRHPLDPRTRVAEVVLALHDRDPDLAARLAGRLRVSAT